MVKIRKRSPSHPTIDLREALDLVGRLYRSDKRHEVEREVAAQNLGYSGLNGRAMSILASLTQYGLIDKVGDGQVRVSDLAVKILYPTDEDSKRRDLREAAMTPKLFKELHDRFGVGLPSDGNLVSTLVRDGFHENAARNVVRVLRSTLEFAGVDTDHEDAAPVVDIKAIDPALDDVDHSNQAPSPRPSCSDAVGTDHPVARDVRREVFTVEEGEVVVSWPTTLSMESYEDIEDWLSILLRKMKRRTNS